MCLTILPNHFKQRWLPFLKKRTAPITLRNHLLVYKVVREIARGSYASPYRETPLTLGIPLVYARLRPELKYTAITARYLGENPLVINEGWHGCLSKANAERMAHSLSSPLFRPPCKVIVAVIPAGTDVYYGDCLEIAAETMILFSDNEQAARWIVDHPVRRK